jgi:hypothetical protein
MAMVGLPATTADYRDDDRASAGLRASSSTLLCGIVGAAHYCRSRSQSEFLPAKLMVGIAD